MECVNRSEKAKKRAKRKNAATTIMKNTNKMFSLILKCKNDVERQFVQVTVEMCVKSAKTGKKINEEF